MKYTNEIVLTQIKELLERSNECFLTPEVILTAMLSLVKEPEKYQDDVVKALADACDEWDI